MKSAFALLAAITSVVGWTFAAPPAAGELPPPFPPTLAVGWGFNADGLLGNGDNAQTAVPVAATHWGALSGKRISAVATGLKHTCVLADGKPYCWGSNFSFQLGNTGGSSSVPVAVPLPGALNTAVITAIEVGDYHSCMIADGAPYCWGDNNQGSLGTTTIDPYSAVPIAVDVSGVLAGKVISKMSADNYTTCVIASGKPYCWGYGIYGQLGNNSFAEHSTTPVAVDTSGVLNGRRVTDLDLGGATPCVIADGQPYCWGKNSSGQVGDESLADSSVPRAVTTSGVLSGKTSTAIASGGSHSCVLAGGQPYCWGDNARGGLGNDSTTPSLVPVAVDTSGVLSGLTITAIDLGLGHSCVLAGAKPFCWGMNDNLQVGDGTGEHRHVPVAVTATSGHVLFGRPVIDIAATSYHTSALAMDDPQFCDVGTGSPFFADVVWLSGVRITTGSGGCFNATGNVSRQAMAAFLYRTLKPGAPAPTCTGTTRTFTDVAADHPFCGAIEWLATTGITTGYANGTFNPSGSVTRQAMAAFIFRGLNPGDADPVCTGTTRLFSDVSTATPFCGSIEWLATAGITTGSGGGYNPTGNVSRQAMAAFLHRAVT